MCLLSSIEKNLQIDATTDHSTLSSNRFNKFIQCLFCFVGNNMNKDGVTHCTMFNLVEFIDGEMIFSRWPHVHLCLTFSSLFGTGSCWSGYSF